MKANLEYARDVEKTRRLLKQFLYALHVSEGFGEERLERVLWAWVQTYKEADKDLGNNMMIIDSVLDKVCPSRLITRAIGKEPIKKR